MHLQSFFFFLPNFISLKSQSPSPLECSSTKNTWMHLFPWRDPSFFVLNFLCQQLKVKSREYLFIDPDKNEAFLNKEAEEALGL